METVVMTITPELAAKYIKRNTNNYRKLNYARVQSYAEDMAKGNWVSNGESIKFSASGSLVDGQHRLHAIVKANVPIETVVVFGIPDDIKLYDVHSPRTTSQIARANGISGVAGSPSVLSAAHTFLSSSFESHSIPKNTLTAYMINHQEKWNLAARMVRVGANHPIANKSACILACYVLLTLGKSLTLLEEFFSIVNTGFQNTDKDGSAAIVLRNALLMMSQKIAYQEGKKRFFSMTCSAFFDYEAGRPRRKIYLLDDANLKLIERARVIEEQENNIINLI